MASGTAITASDIAPVREVVGDSALLFNPDQAQDIADKLFIILSDQHIRQTLIQSGLRQASNFSWTKCAQETLAILQS
jgi:glycosyltransferase involved in cell wall biosynthesis